MEQLSCAKNTPKHWQIKKLGEVCEVIMGQSPPSTTYNTIGIGLPFFQGKAEFTELYPVVEKWCDAPNKIAQTNDILLSVRAPVGATNIANQKCCIGRGLAAIRYENNKYVFYFLRSIQQQLDKKGTGTTFRAISGDTIKETLIPLPPLPEQQAIVAKIEELFSELDKGIESLKTAQQQLTVYRQSLLKAAFEGKLTARWRKEQHTTDFSVAAEPPTKYMVHRELPEGWKKEKLGVVCEIKNGKNQKIVENPNGKYPIYGSAGKMGYANSYLCEAGSTIVGRKGTINKPLYVNEKFWNVDTAFGFIPKTDLIINRFLYFFCLSFNFSKLDKSTTIPSLAKTDLQKIDVILPSIDEQQLIVSELESKLTVCDKMEETINESLQQAETLRQSILKRAFEGRLVNYEIENVNYIDG